MGCSEITIHKQVNRHNFEIDTSPDIVHCIPCSGGGDSSALVMLMHEMFPNVDFQLMFTDTGAESQECYRFLSLIEEKLGKKIERVQSKHSLYGWIDEFNGFLPNSQARWCTRELKLNPFKVYMERFGGKRCAMYIGIRADESDRLAFSIDGVDTVMPFIDLGWNRDRVFSYLSMTIGVPQTYRYRSRSGCAVCPFVRRSEILGLLEESPEDFAMGMKYEKLSEQDAGRHQPGFPLWKDSGIALNWLSLPQPEVGAVISGRKSKPNDLFGANGMFVGGEFFFDGMPGMGEFVWMQKVISYSPTLAGIKRQIDDRYQHLLKVSEVFDMSPEEVRTKVKFAIWYVEMDAGLMDTDGPGKGSYTWQKGQSYAQVRHIVDWVKRALQAEQMRKESLVKVRSVLSIESEWQESAVEGLKKVEEEGVSIGKVVSSAWYSPKEETVLDEEEEMKLMPCPMCHI